MAKDQQQAKFADGEKAQTAFGENPITDGSVPLLNVQHERFCQGIADGLSASESYRQHIGLPETPDESIWPHASQLLRRVRVRVSFLRNQNAEMCKMTKEEALAFCVEVIRAAPEEAAMNNPLCELRMSKMGPFAAFPDKKGMLERLAKMIGWDAADKVEHSGTVAISQEVAGALDGILKS